MGEAKRKTYTAAFKAKVGLEAIRGVKTVNEIGQEYGVHPVQVGQWKREIQEQAETLFAKQARTEEGGRPGGAGAALQRDRAAEGGTGLVEKKVRVEPVSVRRAWIERGADGALGGEPAVCAGGGGAFLGLAACRRGRRWTSWTCGC